MDLGAARSRKQANLAKLDPTKLARKPPADLQQPASITPPATSGPSRFRPKVIDNTDPARFRPKAIRDSTALIWAQNEFPLPPPADICANVTRVDLTGSPCTDVSWLSHTKVTWLSVKGCKIDKGWDEVGSLANLAVLNISDTDLKSLPKSFVGLTNLKALVAMNLPWTTIDEETVNQWTDLNSLILSHSPNLTGLPKTLAHLSQLSKLTCSHCPRLSPAKIPDLSELPLLRDVKMNNLALLDRIPVHMVRWGTGRLPATEHSATSRQGDGLEVLDLGNCSLPFSAVEDAFLTKKWGQLRSLSLHSNPLAVTNPDYSITLQDSETLPKLQIIDSKRIIQRKRKGEIQESKIERRRREKKEKKRMTGANARETTGTVRVWGESGGESAPVTEANDVSSLMSRATKDGDTKYETSEETIKKRKRKAQTLPGASNETTESTSHPQGVETATHTIKKRKRVKSNRQEEPGLVAKPPRRTQEPGVPTLVKAKTGKESRHDTKSAQPAALAPLLSTASGDTNPQRPKRKVDEGKVETVAQSAGGVDLNQVFGKPQAKEGDGGLGVGGW